SDVAHRPRVANRAIAALRSRSAIISAWPRRLASASSMSNSSMMRSCSARSLVCTEARNSRARPSSQASDIPDTPGGRRRGGESGLLTRREAPPPGLEPEPSEPKSEVLPITPRRIGRGSLVDPSCRPLCTVVAAPADAGRTIRHRLAATRTPWSLLWAACREAVCPADSSGTVTYGAVGSRKQERAHDGYCRRDQRRAHDNRHPQERAEADHFRQASGQSASGRLRRRAG